MWSRSSGVGAHEMNGDAKDLRITVAVRGSGVMASLVPLVPPSSSVASVAVRRGRPNCWTWRSCWLTQVTTPTKRSTNGAERACSLKTMLT